MVGKVDQQFERLAPQLDRLSVASGKFLMPYSIDHMTQHRHLVRRSNGEDRLERPWRQCSPASRRVKPDLFGTPRKIGNGRREFQGLLSGAADLAFDSGAPNVHRTRPERA